MESQASPNAASAADAATAAKPAPAAAAAAPAPAPAAPTFKPAPDGMTCKVCNAVMKEAKVYAKSIEYVCSTLKDEPPVLADKYDEWRKHWLGSRVQKNK